MKTASLWLLIVLAFGGLVALYGGIGWCVAWILDKALDVNVNYSIFVWIGIGLFFLKFVITSLGHFWSKKLMNDMEEKFDKTDF